MCTVLHETSTRLDDGLRRLAEYVGRRQDEAGACPADPGAGEVCVSLGALGLDDAYRADAPKQRARVPVWFAGGEVLVGPVSAGRVGTGPGPCGLCLGRRWQALRPRAERDALELDGDARLAVAPALTPFALDLVWCLIRSLPAADPPPGRVYRIDPTTLSVTYTALAADPGCPACGDATANGGGDATARGTPGSFEWRERPKPGRTEYRLVGVDEYDMPTDALVNPLCGVLGRFARRDHVSPTTAPVTGIVQVRGGWRLNDVWWSGHASSYAASERIAMIEGLERLAARRDATRAGVVYDSYENLAPDAMDPAGLGYDAAFYESHVDYQPYSPATPYRWVWGHSLRDRRPRLVPEQLVYYLGGAEDRRFVQECSNGCATGSCPEEAALHGLLELVERDAFLLTWYGAARVPEIDPAGIRDPRVGLMIDRIERLGYDLRLFDIRVDLPVPAVAAVAVRREPALGNMAFAAGASLEPEDAIRAAVCEVASYVPDLRRRVERHLAELQAMRGDHNLVTELSHHGMLLGLPEVAESAAFLLAGAPTVSLDDLYADWLAVRPDTADLGADLGYLVGLVSDLGGDVLVVDQTTPGQSAAGLHTMAAIAPGLVPIDFGWDRQRVLWQPRFRRFLDRGTRGPLGLGATGVHLCPHPFP